jgi:hypothetical protein
MDIKANCTIEDWFLSQSFSSGKDYALKYRAIKEFLAPIHEEVKSIVAKIDPTTYLNAHGCEHIKMVIEKMTMILAHKEIELTLYETYLLLLATQFHDIGHIINGRDNHAEEAGKVIAKVNHQSLDNVEKKMIFTIASAHSGKDNPIGKMPDTDAISNEKVRCRLLSAIVRLADELADGKERASNFLLELDNCSGTIPEESKIFHLFSHCLDSCFVQLDSHAVCLKFFLNKNHVISKYGKGTENIFLIDEIYSRTLKVFIECLYYNRFVPESIRINTVDITINFLCGETLKDFHTPIKYRLEEQGYPALTHGIFDICHDDLVNDGVNIDGQYIANQINN